jgi:hypothetical protein
MAEVSLIATATMLYLLQANKEASNASSPSSTQGYRASGINAIDYSGDLHSFMEDPGSARNDCILEWIIS